MSIFSSIKNFFKKTFGGGGSSSTRRASRVSNYGGGGSRSYSDYSGGGYSDDYEARKKREARQRKERKKKQESVTNALASISKRTDSLASGKSPSRAASATKPSDGTARVIAKISEKSKAAPPDPKEKARTTSQKKTTAKLATIPKKFDETLGKADKTARKVEKSLNTIDDKVKAVDRKVKKDRVEFNKATGNKYNVDKNGSKARRAQKSQAYDVKAEKYETEKHPIATSFGRGALSGVTFGGSEILAQTSKNRKKSGAEAHYQKNKNSKAELAGELAGSLAGFGLTGEASARAVGKVAPKAVKNLGTRGAEKLASSSAIRRAAEKEAVKRFGAEGATKEVINQIAKRRATTAMTELGKDAAINLTTGLASDLSHSALESDNLKDFAKNMGRNAAMNVALGGATSLVPAFRVGRRFDDAVEGAAKKADEAIDALSPVKRSGDADNVKVSLNRRRTTDVRMPEVRPTEITPPEVRPQAVEEAIQPNRPVIGNGKREFAFEVYDLDGNREVVTVRANKASEASNLAGEYGASRGLTWRRKVSLNRRRTTDVRMPEVRPTEITPPEVRPQGADIPIVGQERQTAAMRSSDSVLGRSESVPPRQSIEAGEASYGGLPIRYEPNMHAEARNMDTEIRVSSKFFDYDEATQRHILNHEVSHGWSDDMMAEHAGDWQEFASKFVKEKEVPPTSQAYQNGQRTYWEGIYGDIGATSLSESVTRAITEYLDDPDALMRRSPEAFEAVSEFVARRSGQSVGDAISPQTIQDEAAQIVKKDFERAIPPRVEEDFPVEGTPEAEEMVERLRNSRKRANAEPPTAYEEYQRTRGNLTPEQERIADAHADALRAELDGLPPKRVEKPKPTPKNEAQYASIDEDVSEMGFAQGGDEAAQASKNLDEQAENIANKSKTPFEKQRAEAYEEHGIDIDTDNVEKMTVAEKEALIDKNFRTTSDHTKRGFTTIAVTGDKGFKGVAHQVMDSGETIVDVYRDKPNLAAGAQRVMKRADEEGGVYAMIKDFNEYAEGKRKMTSKEQKDQLYDIIAAVDFANANKDQDWAADLYLAACKAGAEQASGSGLTLRMWQKMAMSSPEYRAKAVKQQILEMFNKSKGFRKEAGKLTKGDKINMPELEELLKKNPALKKTLDALDAMGEATSVDEVQELASKALLQARRTVPMTAFDQLTQWRYVAMLSSPKTHVRNITSNIYSATLGQLRDGIASGIEDGLIKSGKIDKALEKQGLKREDYMKSTGKMSMPAWHDSHIGLASGTELHSLRNQLDKAKLALDEATPSNYESLKKRVDDLEAQVSKKQASYDKTVGGIKRPAAKRAQEAWQTDGYEKLVANAEKFEKKVYNDGISKGAFKINDKLSKFIGNALETSDAISLERIFRERYDKILTANGWEALQQTAKGTGKEAKAAAARLKKLEDYAAQEASYIAATDTYRNYNAISSAMSKYVQDSLFNYDAPMYKKILGGALHATMPFTKVPVNLVKRGVDYSPIGLLTSKKALNDAIAAGDTTAINRACERLAEGRIGTGIAALGAGLGFIDPDGMFINTRLDKNDTLDKRKKDAGYQDYSIQAAGRNITMEWLTPTSSTVFTGVEFGRLVRKAFDTFASDNGLQFDVAELTDVPMSLASSLLEPALQLSVFQGINNSLENVVESDNYSQTNANPWLKLGAGVFSDYARSMLPAVLGQVSRTFAPYDYFVTGDTDTLYGINSTLSRLPLVSNKMFGAKTNSWGQIKNEKEGKTDYVKSAAKNLLSPANINKTTWDKTDEQMMELSKTLGDEIFPKNNYDRELTFGRNAGDVNIKMSNKELAEYNVQRGKSGRDAMADALNTVVFNRWDKDEKGHYTIPHSDNITEAQKAKLLKEYDGKGIKEVAAYIINTPQFKKATPSEQKQIIETIYGTNSQDDSDESRGAKRHAERYIAGKHGISADEYDYFNEVPRNAQELLAPAIESGLISYKQALDFKRGAGKTYYTTDWRGEKGGSVATRYNKKEMLAYLEKAGLKEEEAAELFNAFKQSNAKEYGKSGYRRYGRRRRRGYRRWHSHGGGSSKKATVPKPKTLKSSSLTKGKALVAKGSSSSRKATAPTLERVKAKIDLPTPKR